VGKKIAISAVFFFVAGFTAAALGATTAVEVIEMGVTEIGVTKIGVTKIEGTAPETAGESDRPALPPALPDPDSAAPENGDTVDLNTDMNTDVNTVSGDWIVESEDWAPDPDNAIDELMQNLLKSSPRFFDEKAYGLEGSYAVLGVENGNLQVGGGVDRVRLLALRKEDGIYDRALLLEIAPLEKEPFLIRLSEDIKGFDSKIELKSFVSTRKSEILLSVKSVNDEIGRLLIIEVREGQGHVIYDSRTAKIPTIKGKFFDNYRAEVFVQETGARALIDLSSRKERYNRRLIYHESTGTLRNPVTVWEDRHSLLQPVDVDGDGLYELRGVADLVGVTRSDRIAYVEFTLQYVEGAWHVLDSWVVPVEDLTNLPIPRRINLR
jgi:hypothetical protein